MIHARHTNQNTPALELDQLLRQSHRQCYLPRISELLAVHDSIRLQELDNSTKEQPHTHSSHKKTGDT